MSQPHEHRAEEQPDGTFACACGIKLSLDQSQPQDTGSKGSGNQNAAWWETRHGVNLNDLVSGDNDPKKQGTSLAQEIAEHKAAHQPAPETSAAAEQNKDALDLILNGSTLPVIDSPELIRDQRDSYLSKLLEISAELERVKQQLAEARETIKQARTQAVAEIRLQQAKRNKVEQSNSRLLVALKDAEAMLSAGNEQGIGVIRAAITATEQGGREVK